MADITCGGRTAREINAEIRQAIAGGDRDIVVKDPGARHNLAVGILEPVRIRIAGSAGYLEISARQSNAAAMTGMSSGSVVGLRLK